MGRQAQRVSRQHPAGGFLGGRPEGAAAEQYGDDRTRRGDQGEGGGHRQQ